MAWNLYVLTYSQSNRFSDMSPASMIYVPPEVIDDIFQWAVILQRFPYDHCNLSSAPMPSNVPPINLSQVSKGWRQIALSQPFLWSFVRIDAITNEDLRRALSRVETWLQRSCRPLLHLRWTLEYPHMKGRRQRKLTITRMSTLSSKNWIAIKVAGKTLLSALIALKRPSPLWRTFQCSKSWTI